MSTSDPPHIAATKVIAAGSAGPGLTRVTVLLTPVYAAGSKALSDWPAEMLRVLRAKEWTLCIRVQPVRYVSEGASCALTEAGGGAGDVVIRGKASAALRAWSGQGESAWINDLWRDAFCAKADDARWEQLAALIKASVATADSMGAQAGMSVENGARPEIIAGTQPAGGAVAANNKK